MGIFGFFFLENFLRLFSRYFFHFLELYDDITRFSTENAVSIAYLCLVHRRIQAGNSRVNIGFHHLPCCVPGRASANNVCNH